MDVQSGSIVEKIEKESDDTLTIYLTNGQVQIILFSI